LPNKNVSLCNGVPLVKRAVDLARECGIFDRIVVSTESRKVYEAAGDACWHVRPPSLSLPSSSVWDAVKHWMDGRLVTDYIVLLHPTSPCLKAETITLALQYMIELSDVFDAIVSVNRTSPFSWCSANLPDFTKAKGTQYHLPHFQLNNAIYIAKWDKLYEVTNGYDLKWHILTIPADEAVDIDEITDLRIAEAILQWRQHNEETG
jgi:CMP-N-acetylneuraminic acid synthetase